MDGGIMNKNMMIGIIVVIVLLLGGALLMRNQSATQPTPTVMEEQPGQMTETEDGLEDQEVENEDESIEDEDGAENALKEDVKTFEIDASSFSFSQKEIRVNQGDTVRVVVENDEGMHDWRLDEFNVKTKVLQAGQSETVEFVADKKGTFEYYCSVGQHRANGMVGKLIVE